MNSTQNTFILTLLITAQFLGVSLRMGDWTKNNSVGGPSETSACSNLLSEVQRRFCRSHPMEMWLMGEGSRNAVKMCKNMLEDKRWNCYSVESGPAGLFHKLKRNSREASLVDAISAASMTSALAKGCADGTLSNCPCDKSCAGKPVLGIVNHKWEGCSVDVKTPMRLVKKLLDTDLNKSRHNYARIRLHNHQAGRLAVKFVRKTDCRCHGTSGTCTIQTCYKRLGTLNDVGHYLLKRYNQAIQVHLNNPETPVEYDEPVSINSINENRAIATVQKKTRRHSKLVIKKKDLIFVSNQTDYCNYDPTQGSLGTAGRRCTKENAKYLCCSRGYTEALEIKEEFCNCIFPEGCCELKCQTCFRTIHYGICNR